MKTIDNLLTMDTETGGLHSDTDALMSITMKVYGKDEIKTIYIKPQKKLNYTYKALEVNGITMDFLDENGISEIDAIGEIVKFVDKHYEKKPSLLGQNINFDIGFLDALFERNKMHSFSGLTYHQKRDTQAVSRFFQDAGFDIEKVNLTDAYKFFTGLELKDAHSSEADVLATEALYKAQIDLLQTIKEE